GGAHLHVRVADRIAFLVDEPRPLVHPRGEGGRSRIRQRGARGGGGAHLHKIAALHAAILLTSGVDSPAWESKGFCTGTRNHAAYSAGRKRRVSSVATTRPPMIA